MPTPHSDQLKDAGLRVTRPRLAVLDALASTAHADTAEVISVVRRTLPEVSHQAIYDVLAALSEVGLVRRIQPAGSTARYEVRVGDNHHHAVCRQCGSVTDVDCAVGQAPCLEPADGADVRHTSGFAVDEAEVIYWGTCPACLDQPAPPTSTSDEFPTKGSMHEH